MLLVLTWLGAAMVILTVLTFLLGAALSTVMSLLTFCMVIFVVLALLTLFLGRDES